MKNAFAFLLLLFVFISACSETDPITPTPEPEPEAEPEPTSLRTGLLFHVPFSGNANDIAVNGLTGTVSGATLATDRHGVENEAYRFDGDDYINYGAAPDLSLGQRETYTIAAWVNPDVSTEGQGGSIVTKWNQGVSAGWFLNINSEGRVHTYRNQPPWSLVGEPDVVFGEYNHIAAAYDGTDLHVYLNGELSGSVLFGANNHDRTTELLLGAIHRQNAIVPEFSGTIDEVRIYNRVLTEEELDWLAEN